jgi:nitric oxide synthase oxygenase domain/subunit
MRVRDENIFAIFCPRKVIHHITICHIEMEIIDDFTLLWFNNVIVFDKQIYI